MDCNNEVFNLLSEIVILVFHILVEIVRSIIYNITPAAYNYKDVIGKRVLITGSGSGLGKLLAIRFAKRGCRLILWDVDKVGNDDTANECRKYGVEVSTYLVDLCDRSIIYENAQKVLDDVGKVDILINNAGIVTGRKLLDCSDELIVKTMDVNTMAHFWTTKAFLPGMLHNNDGHIVTIASAAGLVGTVGLADYCASKFAAVGFDESLRYELESYPECRIHTTVVCPFYINTGMFDGVKTRFPGLLPILSPEYATGKIMDAILTNQHVLYMPRLLYFVVGLKSYLPVRCISMLLQFFGVHQAMDAFRGRLAGQQPRKEQLSPKVD